MPSPRYFGLAALVVLYGCVAIGQDEPSAEPKAAAPLPWEPPLRLGEPILRPPASPREILERFGLGAVQMDGFQNGRPLSPAEEELAVQILFHLPRLGLDSLLRWRQTGVAWDQVAQAPSDYRALVFPVCGRVKRVDQQLLPPAQAEALEMTHFYRVTLELEESPRQAILLARRVPAAWPLAEPLDEPASADALFLKRGDLPVENPPLIFAANRVAWLPERPQPERQVGAAQVALAKLGMDAGQWELVRRTNGRGLGRDDREAFYQLLAAMSRPEAKALRAKSGERLNVPPLLTQTTRHQGELLPVAGVARRILKVPVEDLDVQARFGIDHYYEIDLFLPLGNASVAIPQAEKDAPPAVYKQDLPATLIVARLPAALQEAENLHQTIRADGVFFKIWSYKSAYAAKFKQSQPALLFVAGEPALVRLEEPANWVVTALVLAAFAMALAVVATLAWWQRMSDRPAAKASAAAPPPPDFSKLE